MDTLKVVCLLKYFHDTDKRSLDSVVVLVAKVTMGMVLKAVAKVIMDVADLRLSWEKYVNSGLKGILSKIVKLNFL